MGLVYTEIVSLYNWNRVLGGVVGGVVVLVVGWGGYGFGLCKFIFMGFDNFLLMT